MKGAKIGVWTKIIIQIMYLCLRNIEYLLEWEFLKNIYIWHFNYPWSFYDLLLIYTLKFYKYKLKIKGAHHLGWGINYLGILELTLFSNSLLSLIAYKCFIYIYIDVAIRISLYLVPKNYGIK